MFLLVFSTFLLLTALVAPGCRYPSRSLDRSTGPRVPATSLVLLDALTEHEVPPAQGCFSSSLLFTPPFYRMSRNTRAQDTPAVSQSHLALSQAITDNHTQRSYEIMFPIFSILCMNPLGVGQA
ncbi:hypothetical protein K474DRAFT_144396 [Panus rudis PR-1116 ss-1]|nr:hypothetical protein K474DRAFT_144396 [Panus rudis PR-1116 ss-1]